MAIDRQCMAIERQCVAIERQCVAIDRQCVAIQVDRQRCGWVFLISMMRRQPAHYIPAGLGSVSASDLTFHESR